MLEIEIDSLYYTMEGGKLAHVENQSNGTRLLWSECKLQIKRNYSWLHNFHCQQEVKHTNSLGH